MGLAQSPMDKLIKRCLDGDRSAFREIVMRTQVVVRSTLRWHCHDAELVEEVLQSAYVIAWQRLDEFRTGARMEAWLIGIARNLLRQEFSRRKQSQSLDALFCETIPEQEEDANDLHLEHIQGRLQQCMETLSPRARALIDKRYVEGVPFKRLAQRYKVKATTLATQLMRIRNGLKDCLEKG